MAKIALCACIWVACATAHALDPDLQLIQLNHRNWIMRDGAPADITAIAQTTDGALWLGTSGLLYWTDGIRFEPHATGENFRLPSTNISALRAAEDGSLWIGFQLGGVARMLNREIEEFGEEEGLPGGAVHAIAQDADGVMWVATSSGVARRSSDRWEQIGKRWGWTGGAALHAFVDRAGTLWVATEERVLKLPARQQRFHTTLELPTRITRASLAQARDGAVWLSAPELGVTELGDQASGHRLENRTVGQIMFDRDGNLWVGANGLLRLPPTFDSSPSEVQEFSRAQGLSSNSVHTVFEDREGNVWAGTAAGLDRLSHSDFVRVALPWPTGRTAMAAGADGSIWMGNSDARAVLKFAGTKMVQQLAAPPFTSATRARDGVIWFGGPEAVARVVNDRLETIALPESATGTDVQAMTVDGAGALWVAFRERALFRFVNGTWQQNGNLAALPSAEVVSAATDERGDAWFGYVDNRIARVSRGQVRVFTAADGLDVGAVTALHSSSSLLWAGGAHGTAIFDGERFALVRARNCQPFIAVSGIVERNNGDVWLFRGTALSRIQKPRQELTPENTERRLECATFGRLEGLPGSAQQRPAPSLVQSTDGRLWIAATDGVAWFDPDRVRKPPAPPVATILTIREGTTEHDAEGDYIRLPIHTQNLQINFTAWSLTVPEQVRFRYWLEGSDSSDSSWRSMGRERQARYTNLGPGIYRFHVAASHDIVNWGPADSSLEFEILPAFYQTNAFRALCVALAFVLLVLLYRLQVRKATLRLRMRLEERMLERERIARELHDTLLQGVQGLIMRFHSVALRIPEREPLRDLMEGALERADQVLLESRDKVKDLRDVTGGGNDLSQNITEAGKLLVEGGNSEFSVTVNGAPRPLHQIVREETFLIAREALSNAFMHAQAAKIEVELSYERSALRVQVRDDGKGIDTATLQAGGRADHWGLLGMRERAQKIGAGLQIYSRSSAGTEIELRVPARVAYSDRRPARRWSLR